MGRLLLSLSLLAAVVRLGAQQPVAAPLLPLAEIKAGQHGEVWTVFAGTKPEPFAVEVTGIIQNALGPGKSIILCRLTDPRVQEMGAVAGMSGSPLYIDGKFAGALSYQLQHFETVRYAGFTPAADMAEVGDRVGSPDAATAATLDGGAAIQALRPVFALGGVSPRTAEIMAPQFAALGLGMVALGGSAPGGAGGPAGGPLGPGDAVAVALTTGDISMAGTGTVSRVDGDRVLAFGHPMMGLGDVQMPMCAADIVAILPSTSDSYKVANVGGVIGTISQDRLSAVSGRLGPGPAMTDVLVTVGASGPTQRVIHFQVVRDRRIAPLTMLTGVVEGVFGSNAAQTSEGFKITTAVTFSPSQQVSREAVYAGQNGFQAGLFEFLGTLSAELQNPFEKVAPTSVQFHVEPLDDNPAVTVQQFQLSRTLAHPGDTVQVTLGWRDFQGAEQTTAVDIPIDPSWTGKVLEVIVAPGRLLDELTGHPHSFRAGQLRSFDAYVEAMHGNRPEDGLSVAVVERSALFFDQATATADVPASIERIAADADAARFQRKDALIPLWETHILGGKVIFTEFHRTLRVVE